PAWKPHATFALVTTSRSCSSSPSRHTPNPSPRSAFRSIRTACRLVRRAGRAAGLRQTGPVPSVPAQRRVVLLGSTGSIGTQAVDVVTRAADRFRVVALAAHGSDPGLLAEQAARLRVEAAGVAEPPAEGGLRARVA